jgi:hypothetical protein
MIAVFARADHPRGYGFADGRAHGYSVVFVRCRNRREVAAVSKRMQDYNHPFYGLEAPDPRQYYGSPAYSHLSDWYGGRFELLAVVPGMKIDHATYGGAITESRFMSRGDNRYSGIFEAAEVLA